MSLISHNTELGAVEFFERILSYSITKALFGCNTLKHGNQHYKFLSYKNEFLFSFAVLLTIIVMLCAKSHKHTIRDMKFMHEMIRTVLVSCNCCGFPEIFYIQSLMILHDDVIKCKYFPRCRPIVRGIHRWPMDSSHKGQWRGFYMFSLICAWTNVWANKGDVGHLRRHCVHYDVTVMTW